ncbi:unnamed protein product [Colias eurytheme]|nr:unnamed protein product [Colias eurytheme]
MRAEEWIDGPIPSILTTRNHNGEQCTHIIVKNKDIYAQEMMNIVLQLGADTNGQEWLGGSTPLHLCFVKELRARRMAVQGTRHRFGGY